MLMSGALDFLLPLPLYLLIVLAGLALNSWRAPHGDRAHRRRWLWLSLSVWAWVLSAPITSNELIRWLEGPKQTLQATPRDDSTLIVVLASGDPRARLDAAGWERLEGAVQLWRHSAGTLLFSGGPGQREDNALGGTMRLAGLTFGLPANALRFVGGGRNTYEDVLQATPAVRGHSGPVWLVTSALHMPRALATARRQGWNVRPLAVDYQQLELELLPSCLPSNGGPMRLADALHEVIGRLIYRLRGWSH